MWNYFKSTLVTFHTAYKCNTSIANTYVWGQMTEDAVIFIFQLFCICQPDWLHAYCPFYEICVVDTCRHMTIWAQRNWDYSVVPVSVFVNSMANRDGTFSCDVALKFIILSNFPMPRKSTNCLSAAYWFVFLWWFLWGFFDSLNHLPK